MVRPRGSRTALTAFEVVFGPFRRHHVAEPLIAGLPRGLPSHTPILLVANHVSWWDGFILRDVHRWIRRASSFAVLMTNEELRRRPWLRRLGAVGVQRGSAPSALRALRELVGVRRADPEATLLIFPQGAIWPSSRRPLGFQRGIVVLAGLLAPVILLPAGIHMEPLNHRRPTPFISVGEPVHATERPDLRGVEAMVEAQLDAIRLFLEQHGERARDRWPGLFERLPAREAAAEAAAGDVSRMAGTRPGRTASTSSPTWDGVAPFSTKHGGRIE